MIKIFITLILALHGLINLMGFVNGFGIIEIKEFTNKTLFVINPIMMKIFGILWLISCLIFLITVIGLFINQEWWVITALVGIIISQILIIIWWNDAKFGTIANLIILITLVLSILKIITIIKK